MPVTECIAVYIRLSSEDNDVDGSIKAESNSVSAQRMLINEFIKKQDEFINCSVVEYVDDGYSGTNFNRPGFQRMMEDAKAGRIKSIVIKDFSRFGRDYLEVGNYLEKILPVLGIRIISINDGFDSINSSGFTGGMSVALKNMLNAMYSRDLSRKVRSAMKTHAKNGEYMPAFPKYGYIKDPEDKHHLVIDPEAAETVKLIFTMAADGKTKGQIAKYLNETHVLTCREYMCRKGIKMHRENEKEKKLWSVTTISDMLKNEVYLGKIIWNKKRVARTGSNKLVSNDKEEWIVVENAHEPIISDELFRKANEKAFTNQKKVLAKRGVACPIFFCPTCGRRLGFTSRETGYRCMQAHISGLSGCAESKMDRKEAEEINVVKKITKVFDYDEDIEYFGKKYDRLLRKELTQDESDALFITNTNVIDLLNQIKTNTLEPKELENYLKMLKKEAIEQKSLLDNEEFDIFGGIADDSTKIKKIKDKKHRELPKDKFKILDINKNTKQIGFKLILEQIIDNIKNSLEKSKVEEDMAIYKAIADGDINKENINIFNINPEIEIEEKLKDTVNSINLYKININGIINAIPFTNIIFYDNQNKTLPIGMDLSTKILIDLNKLELEEVNTNSFNIAYFENEKDEFSKVYIKHIKLIEYNIKTAKEK